MDPYCDVVIIHTIFDEAPTALALTTSLLSTALPRSECRKHIAFFSASTPFGALVSYGLFSFLEAGGEGDWTGTALLISVSFKSSRGSIFSHMRSGRDFPLRSDSPPARFAHVRSPISTLGRQRNEQIHASPTHRNGDVSSLCYQYTVRAWPWSGAREY